MTEPSSGEWHQDSVLEKCGPIDGCLIFSGALQLFESLAEDEPAAYLHRIEIKARQGPRDLDEAGKLIKLAQQRFPDAQDWSTMQAECHMEEFRQARDPVWLEQADKCLRHGRMPDEWLWVKAKENRGGEWRASAWRDVAAKGGQGHKKIRPAFLKAIGEH